MHRTKINLVIADDHPIVLRGIRSILTSVPHVTLVGEAENSTELFSILMRQQVDLVLTDYAMPGGSFGDGLEMLQRLKIRFPDVKLVVLTVLTNQALLSKIVQLQVHGLLNKSSDLDEIPLALQRVAGGFNYVSRSLAAMLETQDLRPDEDSVGRLSKRELEVLRMYLNGMSIQAIADHMRRSSKTISNQKRMGMLKLGCASDAELFLWNTQVRLVNLVVSGEASAKPAD